MRKIIVKKAGVGTDKYVWDEVTFEIDHGVLMVRDDKGELIHAYSPGAWLEVLDREEADE